MRAEDPRQISPTHLDGPICGAMSFRSRATLTGHAERNGSAGGCPAIPMCTYLTVSVAWAFETRICALARCRVSPTRQAWHENRCSAARGTRA